SVLYTNPTIDGLAEAIIAAEPAEFQTPLVRLRDGGARAPLFFFHGDVNGGGFYTLTLARRLARDRAFWVVHPLGLHGRPAPATTAGRQPRSRPWHASTSSRSSAHARTGRSCSAATATAGSWPTRRHGSSRPPAGASSGSSSSPRTPIRAFRDCAGPSPLRHG